MKMKITSIGWMTVTAVALGCHKPPPIDNKDLRDFKVVNLVANTEEYHPQFIDTTLINAFGIAWSPSGIAWVNSVGGHASNLYDFTGVRLRDVKIPSPADTVGGFPCGIVFSNNMGFKLSNGRSAIFLFSSFDGVISGWNGQAGNNAERLKAPPRASYTGLAIARDKGRPLIYAANFGQKRIDVWDTAFSRVVMPFNDPALPDSYSPYNIQAVGNYLFVMYGILATDRDPNPGHGVAGPGKGFVDVYTTNGILVKRFASRGTLNLPWGVTGAPASFLEGNDLTGGEGIHGGNDIGDSVVLVGNFGDGRINVFTSEGKFLGQLQSCKHVLEIEGLWALSFPPATANIDPRRLYFSAGPDSEADGVFGYLIKQ